MNGLYAAGETMGEIFYYNYPGASSVIRGCVFGRIAAEGAAQRAAARRQSGLISVVTCARGCYNRRSTRQVRCSCLSLPRSLPWRPHPPNPPSPGVGACLRQQPTVVIAGVVLAIFSVLVFVYGLKLSFPIWPAFISG